MILWQAPVQDFVELAHVEFLADFVGAELKEMGVEVLGIEEFEFLLAKELDEKDQGNFAGICHGMKHAFAAEHFAQGHAIESAHEFVILPHFEAMGEAKSVEFTIRVDDFLGDPSIAGSEGGALFDDCLEVAVDAGLERAFAVKSGQVFRHFESMIQRDEASARGRMPINLIVFVGVGHGEGT